QPRRTPRRGPAQAPHDRPPNPRRARPPARRSGRLSSPRPSHVTDHSVELDLSNQAACLVLPHRSAHASVQDRVDRRASGGDACTSAPVRIRFGNAHSLVFSAPVSACYLLVVGIAGGASTIRSGRTSPCRILVRQVLG